MANRICKNCKHPERLHARQKTGVLCIACRRCMNFEPMEEAAPTPPPAPAEPPKS